MTDEQFDTNDWQKGFNRWMLQVDRCIEAMCGLNSACLADQPWADWYEDGVKPSAAAQSALESEGFPVKQWLLQSKRGNR